MGTTPRGSLGFGGDRVERDRDARLLAARDQVAEEITALRLAQDAPSAERLRFLADLATRLDALLAWLAGQPAGGGDLNGLTELAVKLRACDTPGAPAGADLDALWNEAIRVLTEFAGRGPGIPVLRTATFSGSAPGKPTLEDAPPLTGNDLSLLDVTRRLGYMSRTRSVRGWAQQMRICPSGGGSSGSGW